METLGVCAKSVGNLISKELFNVLTITLCSNQYVSIQQTKNKNNFCESSMKISENNYLLLLLMMLGGASKIHTNIFQENLDLLVNF